MCADMERLAVLLSHLCAGGQGPIGSSQRTRSDVLRRDQVFCTADEFLHNLGCALA